LLEEKQILYLPHPNPGLIKQIISSYHDSLIFYLHEKGFPFNLQPNKPIKADAG